MPKYNQPRKTWQYTKDFKIKAVKLSHQDGIQVKQVAAGLDIHPLMLSRWRKKYREGKLHGDNQMRVGLNKINPKKLLNSKWTAVSPVKKEKHFLVTELKFNEEGDVVHCLIEAVISNRSVPIEWMELKNSRNWLQGWK